MNGIQYVGYPDPRIRIAWIDRLKISAAIAVIMTHIASIGWQALEPASGAWFISSVFEIATRFCVPAFFFATGAFLLNPRREVLLSRIYGRYIPKTVIAIAISSFAFQLMSSYLYGRQGWRTLLFSVVDGPYFIWYLWALLGLYVLVPIMRSISGKEELLSYTLGVLLVLVIVKSTFVSMFPNSMITAAFNNIIVLSRGMEGLFYALLGAWFVSHRFSSEASVLLIISGFLSVVIAIWLNYQNALNNAPDLYYVGRDNILIAWFSLGVFELYRHYQSDRKLASIEQSLCSCGLGIYLIHPFLRLAMESFSFFSPVMNALYLYPLLSIPLVSGVIWLISYTLCLAYHTFYRVASRETKNDTRR